MAAVLSAWRISRYVGRKRKLLSPAHQAEKRAYTASRDKLDAYGVKPAVLAAIDAQRKGDDTADFPEHVRGPAAEVDWYDYAPPELLRRM